MVSLTKHGSLPQPAYLKKKSIPLFFLKKTFLALFYGLSVHFSSINRSFSIDMAANAESHICPVIFLHNIWICINTKSSSLLSPNVLKSTTFFKCSK